MDTRLKGEKKQRILIIIYVKVQKCNINSGWKLSYGAQCIVRCPPKFLLFLFMNKGKQCKDGKKKN